MADEQAQDATTETEQASAAAATGQAANAAAQGASEAQGKQTFDADYVKGLRAEAAANRTKAAAAEKRLKELEDEKLSDTEKRDKRLKELEEENARLTRSARVSEAVAACAAAGAVNAHKAARLIDDDAPDIEKAVAALKKSDAYLFTRPGGGSADGGAGGKTPSGGGMNDLIRRSAGVG